MADIKIVKSPQLDASQQNGDSKVTFSSLDTDTTVPDHKSVKHFIGGNSIDTAPAGIVADFIKKQGGHSVITKVLICNNGIAAVKEIRSIRKWAYETFGHERAIEFTVMATPEDLKVNADYIRMADQYVEVPGGSNNNNYANVDLIVDIAERAGVHAVWAGWGHASENPRLPESLAASKQKIVFIGPPGSAMRSLGDKISSTIVAQHADVPCMPWSGTGIKDTIMSEQGFLTVSDEVYQKACIHNAEEGLEKAEVIGFPVMIKASEGGGGKGIRMCSAAEDFKQLYNAVLGEVPGSPVFVMKLAGKARHLEVQLLADQYGNAISIFGRDCSVQRRHQKIIEEAPVTIAPDQARDEMEKAAVRLAKLVGYVSAGTVEWLYSPETNEFSFLELNPRLQVEHPTTEMVSGVNIPAAQLQVAMGIPLYRIADIRTLYGMNPRSSEVIDFDFVDPESSKKQRKPQPRGHVVACRITAENPDTGFKPGMGALTELNFRSSTSTWGYFSVGTSGALHEYADSQFGHIFAYGADRSEARKQMVISLKELSIRGDFRTTVEYLIKLLETDAFESNKITTGWLDGLIQDRLTAERPPQELAIICGAAVKAHLNAKACEDEYKSILNKGQVPPRNTLKTVFSIDFIYEGVKYNFTATRSSESGWTLYLNGARTLVSLRPLTDGGLLVGIAGKSHPVYWREEVGMTRLMVDSKTCLIEQENDPTQIRSPSPGKLVRFLVESGDHVDAGQSIAEIEVMKMYLPLVAAEDGIVSFVKSPGVSLTPGDIIGILSLDDPSRVQHAKPFAGQLKDYGLPIITGSKPHQRFAHVLGVLNDILGGFDQSYTMQASLKELIEILRSPELPYGQASQVLSTLSGRIPARLEDLLRSTIDAAQNKGAEFPAARLRKLTDNFIRDSVDSAIRAQVTTTMSPLTAIFNEYAGGLKAHESSTLASLFNRYAQVESVFTGEADVVLALRQQTDNDLDAVVAMQLSHNGVLRKNALIMSILDKHVKNSNLIPRSADAPMSIALTTLAGLQGRNAAPVALKAREVSIAADLPSLADREAQMESILKASVTTTTRYGGEATFHTPSLDVLRELADSQHSVYDVLHSFFGHQLVHVAFAALVTYVVRAYRAYDVLGFDYHVEDFDAEERAVLSWDFKLQGSNERERKLVSRQTSATDLRALQNKADGNQVRKGVMTSCSNVADLSDVLPKVLKAFGRQSDPANPTNVLNIAVTDEAEAKDAEARELFVQYVNQFSAELRVAGVRRVTFLICQSGQYPKFATLRPGAQGKWTEETSIRNVEPALAYQLELDRMSATFDITSVPVASSTIHLYFARGIANPADCRFFVRSLVRPGRIQGNLADYLVSESDRIVNDILNTLEVALGQAEYRNADASHIFMSFIYELDLSLEEVQTALAGFIDRHGQRLFRLRITGAEIRIVLKSPNGGEPRKIRTFITNETGFTVRYEAYEEIIGDDGTTLLNNINVPGYPAPQHMQSAHAPYMPKVALQSRRSRAHALQTTFAYDFIDVLRQSIRASWKKAGTAAPAEPIKSSFELIFDENEQLREVTRAPGMNKIGMVAWIIEMLTPEYPTGRKMVLIANDVTVQAGSFGPTEDRFFAAASRLSRQLGIPRLYISANSGARIGLATEPLELFKAKFINNDAAKGFEYLYLDEEGFHSLNSTAPGSVITKETTAEDGSTHHVITDIIGLSQNGLGVECLSGSGLIAGETSRARDEIFTATIVTGRSVGIGAYLARLGERLIQVEGSPLILTGYQALNKLLGREVYTSNLQLGGPQIMYRNGVSHLTAADDLAAMREAVNWLSYVPAVKGGSIPRLLNASADTWDRPIAYTPPKGPYDPRWLIGGKEEEDGSYLSGFFDKGSFQETLGGWATSVIVGRARLGGLPMGVIAVETRTLERVVPADPANPASTEQRIMEAGQVWYPNSAYKTAQAIADFNKEGLPLIIFANWRGFSGGQEDMFKEILKYGSMIVDGLSSYKQPAFVTIPPNGELRGGAFVVVDSTINDRKMMELTADETARGGVLEPEGTIEVKYRPTAQLATMHRLDPRCAELVAVVKSGETSAQSKAEARTALAAREKELAPIFSSIATTYADLHDKAGRMKSVGVIREILSWDNSRRYFYQRLRRRLAENTAVSKMESVSPSLSLDECYSKLNDALNLNAQDDDASVADALESNPQLVDSLVDGLKEDDLLSQLSALSVDARQRLLLSLQSQN